MKANSLNESSSFLTLFLSGDVMPGRGIDQILPKPSSPQLYEPYVRDARDYLRLAEKVSGSLPKSVGYDYIWGKALKVLQMMPVDLRIINLETAITTSEAYWKGKGIHYRMHPANTAILSAAGIDCCVLANNHVLDWGYSGLNETLGTLHDADIHTAGAGQTRAHAQAPAILGVKGKGRVLVYSFGHISSGIPPEWSATDERAGVAYLESLTQSAVHAISALIDAVKAPGDVVVVSLHWGGNWGYQVSQEQRQFAHSLIDEAGVDVVYGHSSHHPKGIEVYRNRPILYGCGDLLNDYEGIEGYEPYRDDLSLMYFPTLTPADGRLARFILKPLLIRRFQLNQPAAEDIIWIRDMLNREGEKFGTAVELVDEEGWLELQW